MNCSTLFANRIVWILLIGIALFSLGGCASSKQTSQNEVKGQQEAGRRASRKASDVSQQSQQAVKDDRISESANERIQAYLAAQQDSIRLDSILMAENLREIDNAGKKGGKNIASANSDAHFVVVRSAERIRAFEEKTAVILDFLNSETFSKSEMNTLFPVGEYRLKASQSRQGRKFFEPTVDKLYAFSEKYKGAFKSMQGEIVITGYSDATPIEQGSKLYNELAHRLSSEDQITQPTRTQLNLKLSELRAGAVKEIVENIVRDKKTNDDFLNVSVTTIGRGEETPPFLTGNVTADDKRRRIVTFYWVVLPTM